MMSEHGLRREVFTLPNLLSFFRLGLIPLFSSLYLSAEGLADHLTAAGVLALSALTDMADGMIARKCHMISRLGIILDPIADKLTQGAALLCLLLRKKLSPLFFALFLCKEFLMFLMGTLLLRRKKMPNGALFAGKLSTVILFCVMILLAALPSIPRPVGMGMLLLSAAFMLFSLTAYVRAFLTGSNVRELSDPISERS